MIRLLGKGSMRITVHNLRNWIFRTDTYEAVPGKRTADEKDRLNRECVNAHLEIIPNTAEVVDSSHLDERGRYFPRH
jgi:hypothetical protein